MSPESLMGNVQSYSSDIWALGILLYELHMNKEPFPGKSSTNMLQLISNNPINFSSQHFNLDGMNLVKNLLKYKEKKRAKIPEILNSSFLFDLTEKHLNKATFLRPERNSRHVNNVAFKYINKINEKLNENENNSPKLIDDISEINLFKKYNNNNNPNNYNKIYSNRSIQKPVGFQFNQSFSQLNSHLKNRMNNSNGNIIFLF